MLRCFAVGERGVEAFAERLGGWRVGPRFAVRGLGDRASAAPPRSPAASIKGSPRRTSLRPLAARKHEVVSSPSCEPFSCDSFSPITAS